MINQFTLSLSSNEIRCSEVRGSRIPTNFNAKQLGTYKPVQEYQQQSCELREIDAIPLRIIKIDTKIWSLLAR